MNSYWDGVRCQWPTTCSCERCSPVADGLLFAPVHAMSYERGRAEVLREVASVLPVEIVLPRLGLVATSLALAGQAD
jgi:hypothetical protein